MTIIVNIVNNIKITLHMYSGMFSFKLWLNPKLLKTYSFQLGNKFVIMVFRK